MLPTPNDLLAGNYGIAKRIADRLTDAGKASGGLFTMFVAVDILENVAHLPVIVTDIADGSLTIVFVLGALWSSVAICQSIWSLFKHGQSRTAAIPQSLAPLTPEQIRTEMERLRAEIQRLEEALKKDERKRLG